MISFHYHAQFEFPRALFQIPHAVLKKLKKSQTTYAAQETNKRIQHIQSEHTSWATLSRWHRWRTNSSEQSGVSLSLLWIAGFLSSVLLWSIFLFFFIKYVLSVWFISWWLGSVITVWWWEHNGRIWQRKMGKMSVIKCLKLGLWSPRKVTILRPTHLAGVGEEIRDRWESWWPHILKNIISGCMYSNI